MGINGGCKKSATFAGKSKVKKVQQALPLLHPDPIVLIQDPKPKHWN
jgi:hypothetical protein